MDQNSKGQLNYTFGREFIYSNLPVENAIHVEC
uniref:Uncharacterized protein n=1 Tax=Arundo donax TaxID=35708 RepID=A0A0A9BWU0_ARUDO